MGLRRKFFENVGSKLISKLPKKHASCQSHNSLDLLLGIPISPKHTLHQYNGPDEGTILLTITHKKT